MKRKIGVNFPDLPFIRDQRLCTNLWCLAQVDHSNKIEKILLKMELEKHTMKITFCSKEQNNTKKHQK